MLLAPSFFLARSSPAALPTYVGAGAGTATADEAVNLTPALPAGVQTGDLMLCQIGGRRGGGGTPITSVTAGWTLVGTAAFSAAAWTWLYYKFHDGSESAPSINWAWEQPAATGESLAARVYAWRGVNPSDPFEDFDVSEPVSGIGPTYPMPAVTTTVPNSIALSFSNYSDDDTACAAATGMTGGTWIETVAEFATSLGFDQTIHAQHAVMASPGTITGGSVAIAGGDVARCGVAFAIQPVGGSGSNPEPPGEPVPPATVVPVDTSTGLTAINAIPADRTIQFADGTYSLGGTIVPKTGQYYRGNLSNPAAVVLQGTGNFRAFNGGGAIAPGCVIKSLKITGYDCGMGRAFVPNPTNEPDNQDEKALLGAIEQASGWQILDCHVVANYCSGMTIGNGTRVARCLINDNGHKGIGGGIEANSCRARDLVIEDNQINNNCRFDMNKTWDSGGIKLIGGATPGGLNPALNPAANNIFRRNRISRNNGPGIWWDWDVLDGEIANNSIFLNHSSGIVIEASATAHIHHNQIGDNCTGSLPALITFRCNTVGVQNSKRCIIEDNLFYVNRELAGALTQHNRAVVDAGIPGSLNTPKGGIYVGWFTGVENEWRGNVWLMEANGLFSAQLDSHSCSNNNSACTGVSCSQMCGTEATGCVIASTPTGPTIGGNFMCFIPQAADNHLNVQDGDTFRIASGTANKWSFQTNSTQITGSLSAFVPDWDVVPSWTTPPGK